MKLKIAIIAPGSLPVPAVRGGAIETLIDALLKENELRQQLDITVFSCADLDAEKAALGYASSRFVFLKQSKCILFIHRVFRKLLNIISRRKYLLPSAHAIMALCKMRKKEFDAIVIEGCPEFVHLFTRVCNCVVLHIHADVLHIGSMNALSCLSQSNAVFAVSDYIKGRICQIDAQQKDKVVTVKNCVDTDLFAPNMHGDFRKQFRNTYKMEESDIVFFFSGRLDEGKGIKQLLQAFCAVKRSDAWLVVAGGEWFSSNEKSPFVEELVQIAKAYEERIIFLGYVDHCKMPEYYAAVDIVVVPSVCYEAAPLSAIEAMCSGKGLIASNRGGLPEYVKDYSLCVDAGKDVADQLSKLLCLSAGDFPNNVMNYDVFVSKYSQGIYYSQYCKQLTVAVKRTV